MLIWYYVGLRRREKVWKAEVRPSDTHLLILLPQISSILRFFVYKNLRLARSRAYALTVASRGKPAEFWSQVSGDPSERSFTLFRRATCSSFVPMQGYIEEWADPPRPARGEMLPNGKHRRTEAKWISWLLWWPTQLVLRHCKCTANPQAQLLLALHHLHRYQLNSIPFQICCSLSPRLYRCSHPSSHLSLERSILVNTSISLISRSSAWGATRSGVGCPRGRRRTYVCGILLFRLSRRTDHWISFWLRSEPA